MLTLSIPGYNESMEIKYLIVDFNGTLAIDGMLITGVREAIISIAEKLEVHVLTGNTLNNAEQELKDLPCKVVIMPHTNQGIEKGKYVSLLDPKAVISIGNGRNDQMILQQSAIGIIVIQKEGAAAETLQSADIVCSNILDALDLLNNTRRLVSTLRS
jgi:soluble P-type ATPase